MGDGWVLLLVVRSHFVLSSVGGWKAHLFRFSLAYKTCIELELFGSVRCPLYMYTCGYSPMESRLLFSFLFFFGGGGI